MNTIVRHTTLTELTACPGPGGDFIVTCANDGSAFSVKTWCRFKHGYKPVAEFLGRCLADQIGEALLGYMMHGPPVIVVSAPYRAVPTASHTIATAMLRRLSHCCLAEGIEPPRLVHLRKAAPGSAVYADSTHAERAALLAELGLHIDTALVKGAVVLVVDDLRVGGNAEAATHKYLAELGPHTLWYLHGARFDWVSGMKYPKVEAWMNQVFPISLATILADIRADQFALNTRVLRWIMEQGNTQALQRFWREIPFPLLQAMYDGCMGSGIAYIRAYEPSFSALEAVYNIRASRTLES